jgi:hypothetical protein
MLSNKIIDFQSLSLKKREVFLIITILVLIAALVVTLMSVNSINASANNTLSGSASKAQIQAPTAKIPLNKEFSFPIKNDKNQEVGKIKYLINGAEERDEIIIKGQKATAVAGRTFLILNLKIDNNSKNGIQMNTRDYVRLTVNNGSEWLAPDIHNDPVEIQAISTKYTRIGFPISDTDKKLKLQIGEINGDKEIVDLKLSNL